MNYYYTLKLNSDSIPIQNKVAFTPSNPGSLEQLTNDADKILKLELEMLHLDSSDNKISDQFDLFIYDSLNSDKPVLIY